MEVRDRNPHLRISVALGILLAALTIRFLHLDSFSTSVVFDHPIFDEAFYDEQARSIAGGNWIGHEAYFMGPLYSHFLGILYVVFSGSRYWALFVQSLVGSMTCVLTYLVGRKVVSNRTATLAALISCQYGILIFYDSLILMESLTLFLNMACLLLLLEAVDTNRWYLFLAAGLCLGLSALGRASVLLFAPAAALWIVWISRSSRRQEMIRISIFCGAVLATVSLVTVRNYWVAKDLVPISANGGINFYIGNGPGANGTFRIPDEIGMVPDDIAGKSTAELATGRIMKLSEVSHWWYTQTLSFVRAHPLASLRNLVWKIKLLWNGYEIPQLEWYDACREHSRILRLPLVTSKYVIPLGLCGVILCLRRSRRSALLLLYIAAQTLAISLFFVTSRYRVTVLPVLCIFAAYSLIWFLASLVHRRYKAVGLALGAVAAIFWLTCPTQLGLHLNELRRWHLINLGLRYSMTEAGLARAESLLEEAVAISPKAPDAHVYHGIVLRRATRYEEALDRLATASSLDPRNPVIPFQVGKVYNAMSNDTLAIDAFRRALSLAPLYRDAHEHLAHSYAKIGRYQEALSEFSAAAKIDPTDSSLRVNLGVTYANMGMLNQAIRQFELALIFDATNWKARYNLAAAFLETGQLHEARRQLQAILDRNPDNEAARDALLQLAK
jgi:tetratricopeptide (TPR) repeat protein